MLMSIFLPVWFMFTPTPPMIGGSGQDIAALKVIFETRIGQMLYGSTPVFLVLALVINLQNFIRSYVNFPQVEIKLLGRIKTLHKDIEHSIEETIPNNPVNGDPEVGRERTNPFSPRVRVRHPQYGQGVILNSEGTDDDEVLTVQFPRYGIKKVLLKNSQLEYL
jgi:hypothetical protein